MSQTQLKETERVAAVAIVRRAVARALDHDRLISEGETVVVACSGGADSTTLLDALARLARPRRLRLVVATIDHGLRAESLRETGAVKALAATYALPCEILKVKVASGGSLQDNARQARGDALRQYAQEVSATTIAVGHTADDQAETVLMRALSGATPRSLGAIAPRQGLFARPLLTVWRAQTAAYCFALGIVPVDDPSNHDPRFLRTRVRDELIPALERVFPAAKRRLVALAAHQRQLVERVSTGDDEGRDAP